VKTDFYKSDTFFAIALALVLLALSASQLFQALEFKAYDMGASLAKRDAGDKIAIITIDDQSIENIGRWPWSRQVHAKMLTKLKDAKVVSNTVFFIEPQVDAGLDYIREISKQVDQSSIANSNEGEQLKKLLTQANLALDVDQQLAQSLAESKNVVLAMPFILGNPQGNPDIILPDYISKYSLTNINGNAPEDTDGAPSALSVLPPIAPIAKQALAVGHLNSRPDVDGVVRVEPLVIHYDHHFYPSMALESAMQYLNLSQQDVTVNLGKGIKVGNLTIATDDMLQMNTFFYSSKNGKPAFSTDSFFDVYTGKIPPSKYKGKIVLIGMSATGIGDRQTTPISANMAPIETLANTTASILNEDFFITPNWALGLKLVFWILILAYLIWLLPKLKANSATLFTSLLALGMVTLHFVFMTQHAWWVPLMAPFLLLIFGHLLLSTKRYLTTERGKLLADAESSESNKNLALMLQSQGQLDMAFDRFRKCTLNNPLMDALYSLGLDFERKRQFNKAESVFTYMATYDANYKDLNTRISRSKELSETVILGSSTARKHTNLVSNNSIEKPMLGRYQIEKELGKGAMGTVYLGVDPKIGRQVAIKTLALSEEFEASELESVKSRFFREAETAGKLNHPNIVTIYDAGEEHDLAYIAMELLQGQDLNQHAKPDSLLPLPTVLTIAAKVAEALDYAHHQHVIHRDIKPANIMYEASTGAVKVTDFGIARISDSSKTKTGMVLGTPNFMSPEQLSGKKLDGRSDLFALGTTLYQLTTGQLPFEGDSMASLMYKISHETQQDITSINTTLPQSLSIIITKLLEKDTSQRYQLGKQVSEDIIACLEALKT
jgi:eukaryotic-like serine/threonine-protein kinase